MNDNPEGPIACVGLRLVSIQYVSGSETERKRIRLHWAMHSSTAPRVLYFSHFIPEIQCGIDQGGRRELAVCIANRIYRRLDRRPDRAAVFQNRPARITVNEQ